MNPYVALGIAAAWALSCWYAYETGGDNRENAIKANYAKQLDEKIKEHNEDAAIDMEAAAEWGRQRGFAQGRADKAAGKIERDAIDNPQSRECALSPAAVGLRNDAIRNANNLAPGADSVPDAVPRAAGTGIGRLPDAKPLGGLGHKPSGGLQAPTR